MTETHHIFSVADGKNVTVLDKLPEVNPEGFIQFGGVLREVREIHRGTNWTQIEIIEP